VCGLIGQIDLRRLGTGDRWTEGEIQRFAAIRDVMTHRGPSGAGLWMAPGVLLGHRRLAILDLTDAAAQPMVSPLGTVLVFNGEIYNFVELRRELEADGVEIHTSGDTGVLLAALDRWGLDGALPRLRGMFAFAVWRPAEQRLWLARDPVGKKPLFYGRYADRFAFGSSLEVVLRALGEAGFVARLDAGAVCHALAVGTVAAPRTGVAGIRKLVAGCRVVFDARNGSEATGEHWRVPFPARRARLDEALPAISSAFQEGVRRRLRSDVPVATFLSGGLDSSLVTAAASRGNPGIIAYTARTGDNNADELDLACRIASHLKIEHRIVDVDSQLLGTLDALIPQFGEAFCDSSSLPMAAICKAAGVEHRVVLTGDGGDEVQGGYQTAAWFALRQLVWGGDPLGRRESVWRKWVTSRLDVPGRRLDGGLSPMKFRLLRLVSSPEYALRLRHDGLDQVDRLLLKSLEAEIAGDGWPQWQRKRIEALGASSGLDAQLGLDFSSYLADDLNVKVDVAAMASSVEARAPLLDLDFVNLCWGVRSLDRVRPWSRKRVVRMLARQYLPESLLITRKHGFSVPVGTWLRESGAMAQLEDDLKAGATGLEEFLDGSAVIREIQENRSNGREPVELAWRVHVLGKWARWVRGTSCPPSAAGPL